MFTSPVRGVAAVVLSATAVIGLGACSAPGPHDPVSEQCRTLFDEGKAGDGPRVVVVTDATRSSAPFALDDAALEVLTSASKANGTVSVLAVDGAGATANWVGNALPLNDANLPSDTSAHARIVDMAPDCVRQLAATARPTAAGSDILGALQLAAQKLDGSGSLLMGSDGLANSGILDMRVQRYGSDPAAIVAALDSAGQLPRLSGIEVTIGNLGAVDGAPLNQVILDWFSSVYGAICLASDAKACNVSTGEARQATPAADLPADVAVPLPVFEPPVVEDGACVYTIAGGVLFADGSAVLDPSADVALAEFADRFASSGLRILVEGHTSTDGDAAANDELSRLRAEAVMARLLAFGLNPQLLSAVGKGETEPRVTPDVAGDGSPLEPANGQNRRVELEVSGLSGCV